jgi:hypothetical protein
MKPLHLSIRFLVITGIIMALLLTSASPSVAASSWAPYVTVDSSKNFRNIDIGFGQNGLYLMTWLYSDGSVLLYKSMDNGQTWSSSVDVFGGGLWNSYPGMCVYKDGGNDTILIAGGENNMAKSTDNGATFSTLQNLPMPYGTSWWRYMAIGTNASWFGTAPDNDIYVVGARYDGAAWSGTYIVTIVKSTDGGASWKTPISISSPDYSCYYPEILSNGSTLFVAYSKIMNGGHNAYTYIRSSSDWGATWSAEKSIPISTVELGAAANSFQYLDKDKAMLAISQNSVDPAGNCTQYYGYLYFGNKTFQEVGHAVGSDWCFDICGASCRVINGKDLAMAWIYEPYSTTIVIDTKRLRYAVCSDAGFNTTVIMPSEIQASVNIDPNSLDVSSNGKWITAYIDLPAPENVSNIDVSSIRVDRVIPINSSSIGDFDKDNVPEMMVKFDRAIYVESLGAVTKEGRNVTVSVSGSLADDRIFSGVDTIRVFDGPGKGSVVSTFGGILGFLGPAFPIALIGIAGIVVAITAFVILRKRKHMRGA